MNYNFEIGGFLYIPVHLNLIYMSRDKSFSLNFYSNALADELVKFLESANIQSQILIDFEYLEGSASRVFNDFVEFFTEKKKKIYFLNLNKKISKQLFELSNNSDPLIFIEKDKVIALEEIVDNFFENFSSWEEFSKIIKQFKIDLLGKYIKGKSDKGSHYLDSSNIFSNIYIDIKTLFADNELTFLASYEMAKMFFANFKYDYDGVICVSNNGAALATIIADLLNTDAIYLFNLGPHSTIMSDDLMERIHSNKRYVFIYDFSCLGTEIKLVKTVVNLIGAKVIGSVGVSRYLDRSDKGRIGESYPKNNYTIFRINDDYDLDYQLSFFEIK